MSTRTAFWLACLLFAAGTNAAAEPACAPTAPGVAIAMKSAKLKESAKQIDDKACRTVKLDLKAEGNSSIKEIFKLAFAPAPKAGDRLKPPVPAGMPTGAVMPQNGQIVFNAGELSGEGLVSLDIDGPQLNVRLRPPPGVTQLPITQLKQGVEYRWVLTTKRQAYDATFQLPDAATLERTTARLKALAGLSVDATTLLILEAAIYDDEELYSSRDRVIAQLRRELNQ